MTLSNDGPYRKSQKFKVGKLLVKAMILKSTGQNDPLDNLCSSHGNKLKHSITFSN